MNRLRTFALVVAAAAPCLLLSPITSAAPPVADVSLGTMQVEWQPTGEFAGMSLRVSGPLGVVERDFAAGENPQFDLGSMETVADGLYTWEIVAAPRLDEGVRRAMAEARAAGDGAAEGRLRASGALPNAGDMVQSGSFRVVGGVIQQPSGEAERSPGLRQVTSDVRRVTAEDQVIPDDLIVQGSICAGLDCVNNENFGFDTIRMKENNTRIDFTDTSSTAGFPTQDWEIAANDSASGGRNALIVSDENTQLFVVESGNIANALYVDDAARVGLRTSNPVLDLHISTGNTPGIRLEQTNASGFTAQTWDIAGNEANFFVRDVTGGSLLPFRIRPGAPTSSVDISASGNVGIGTASPNVDLHILRTAEAPADVQFKIEANTDPAFDFAEQDSGVTWRFINNNAVLRIADVGTGSDPAEELSLNQAGNLTITGQIFTGGSCNTGCDLVFSPDYQLPSIEEHEAVMLENRHLPAVGPTPENGPFNLSQMTGGMLNELEKAHLYIAQLNHRIKQKDDEVTQLRDRLSALETALSSITAQ